MIYMIYMPYRFQEKKIFKALITSLKKLDIILLLMWNIEHFRVRKIKLNSGLSDVIWLLCIK